MQFPDPLIRGRLLRRYKRFLADVVLDAGQESEGQDNGAQENGVREVVAHCANPGSMMGLAEPGSPVWLSPANNPARKLRYSWELVEAASGTGSTLVGINTGRANALVAEALEAGRVAELVGYAGLRREVRYGTNSRVDFLLEAAGRPPCYLEVKSVTLRRSGDTAEFPDAVTARGTRHLVELAAMARQGARAVLFFLVQRGDCRRVAPAGDIDPAYAAALKNAQSQGVEVLCYQCSLSPEGIALDARLPLVP